MTTILLKPLEPVHMDNLRRWRNDEAVWQWCRQNDLISTNEQGRWFDAQDFDPDVKNYAIFSEIATHKDFIGVAGFSGIDYLNRRAEFSILIAPEFQGNGYGLGALRALIQHGFLNLGFNVIWGECFDGNPALKTFAMAGMKPDGRRRQFYYRKGRFIDAILVSITREEWDAARANDNQQPDPSAAALRVIPSPSAASKAPEDWADHVSTSPSC